MLRVLLAALVLALAAPIPASAATSRHLLAAVAIPSVPVTVHNASCPFDLGVNTGCYLRTTNEMWIPDRGDRATYWHEMGHAVDAQLLTDGARNAFKCLPAMWMDHGTDKSACTAPWAGDVAEMFADAYADCRMRLMPSGDSYFLMGHGYWPDTDRRHLNACRFIARATR